MRAFLKKLPVASDSYRYLRMWLPQFMPPKQSVTGFRFIGNSAQIQEIYEVEIAQFLLSTITHYEHFVNVGANIGYYSCVAKKFNPNISVHGFEPMPSASKYFKNNCTINGFDDIKVHQTALTNFKGEAIFHTNINQIFTN